MRQVLAIDVPPSATGVGGAATLNVFQEATRRIGELPGVLGIWWHRAAHRGRRRRG
jgi:hypothetical protein